MRAICVAVKSVKIDKNSLKMAKIDAFSNIFDNISGTQAHMNLEIRYPSGDGLLQATVATISFVCPYLKRSRPPFALIFNVLGPVKAARLS